MSRTRFLARCARPAGLAALIGLAAVLDLLACKTTRVAPVPPVEPRASMSFAAAQARLEAGDVDAARAGFAEAARLEPGWPAPVRALDDLDRDALLGPELLAERRAALADGEDAGELYLVGRLEGAQGTARFQRGIDLDPSQAWNHHGLAWNLYLSGSPRQALRPGRRAVETARDTWEKSYFTIALARYELALGRADRAAELCSARIAETDVLASDLRSLSAWLAQAELSIGNAQRAAAGWRRGLELIAGEDLTDADLGRLVRALLLAPPSVAGRAGALEVSAALAARDGAMRRNLRAAILLEDQRPALAIALLEPDEAPLGVPGSTGDRLRVARFARGQGRAAIEDWARALPSFVLDARGVPLDPRLARLVLAARDGDDRELAAALIACGWFTEAGAFAESLAFVDPEAALALDAQASAGRVLLTGVQRVLEVVDRGQPYGGPFARAVVEPDADRAPEARRRPTGPRAIDTLDGLLDALEPIFDTYRVARGEGAAKVDLRSSPRATYGPAATVVHPGPFYSDHDARLGLGRRGEPVAGLASELAAIGRFGIFGEAVGGGGPDGTMLRVVHVEERSGRHLGVPWRGVVAWCDGADVASRPGRRGASISGAALHEGYWVDLAIVREELGYWRALERSFLAGGGAEARRALEVIGLEVPLGGSPSAMVPLLGEADRVRLAVLVERKESRAAAAAADGEGTTDAPLITLEELARLTALHEEGHLCDRTRFLPIGKNLLGSLRLLAAGGFQPQGVARELEERAQLVALCDAPDPRIPLADVLGGAENGGSVTPHAAAYTELLERWLVALEQEARRDPDAFPGLDRGRAYAHQLHRLRPEEVRRVSLVLARKKGLVRD